MIISTFLHNTKDHSERNKSIVSMLSLPFAYRSLWKGLAKLNEKQTRISYNIVKSKFKTHSKTDKSSSYLLK